MASRSGVVHVLGVGRVQGVSGLQYRPTFESMASVLGTFAVVHKLLWKVRRSLGELELGVGGGKGGAGGRGGSGIAGGCGSHTALEALNLSLGGGDVLVRE